MYEVIPGILEKDWSEIEKKIELVKSFTKTVHIDIIDGKFAPNTTFLDPSPFKKYSNDIFLELHMMVEEPIHYLKPWAEVGFKRFLGHIEKMSNQAEFVAQGQRLGEVGLAVDGPTSLNAIKVPYQDLDAILIYTSGQVGFSGPPFHPERLGKIRQVRSASNIQIEVDGGITDQTVLNAKQAGATRFVTTSYLLNSTSLEGNYKNLITKLREYSS